MSKYRTIANLPSVTTRLDRRVATPKGVVASLSYREVTRTPEQVRVAREAAERAAAYDYREAGWRLW